MISYYITCCTSMLVRCSYIPPPFGEYHIASICIVYGVWFKCFFVLVFVLCCIFCAACLQLFGITYVVEVGSFHWAFTVWVYSCMFLKECCILVCIVFMVICPWLFFDLVTHLGNTLRYIFTMFTILQNTAHECVLKFLSFSDSTRPSGRNLHLLLSPLGWFSIYNCSEEWSLLPPCLKTFKYHVPSLICICLCIDCINFITKKLRK